MKAYQIDLPRDGGPPCSVLMREHASDDLERIYSVSNLTGDEPGPVLMNKMAIAGLQISIFEVDGKPTTFELNRQNWRSMFNMRDVILLAKEWTKLYYGDSGNVRAVPVVQAA